jgi:hypothetical protein
MVSPALFKGKYSFFQPREIFGRKLGGATDGIRPRKAVDERRRTVSVLPNRLFGE